MHLFPRERHGYFVVDCSSVINHEVSHSWDEWIHNPQSKLVIHSEPGLVYSQLEEWVNKTRDVCIKIMTQPHNPRDKVLMRQMKAMWLSIPWDAQQALYPWILAIVDRCNTFPPLYLGQGLFCQRDEEEEAMQLAGMTLVRWAQLINAAMR